MIWVIANKIEEDGSFPTYSHYKKAFNDGEIDIYCATSDSDFSFLKKDDVVWVRNRDEKICQKIREQKNQIGFRSILESDKTNLLTFDKLLVKDQLKRNGIPYPKTIHLRELKEGQPYIVKPNFGENSVGIDKDSVCFSIKHAYEKLKSLQQLNYTPFIEEYINGHEVTVSVIFNWNTKKFEIYPSLILPKFNGKIHTCENKKDFSFEALKYWHKDIEHYSKLAFYAVGAKHHLRLDYRVSKGIPYLIDINMIPGLAPEGYFSKCMQVNGIDYYDAIRKLINSAC